MIVRKVNVQQSTHHLEGNTAVVSVETLLQAAQEFSSQLLKVLRDTLEGSAYKARTVTILLFEDNGRETGIQGELVTLSSALGRSLRGKN